MNKKDGLLHRLINARWFPYLVIGVLICVLYHKTLAFRFTVTETKALVQESVEFLNSNASIFDVFSSPLLPGLYDFYYRPVLMLSFILDASLGGSLPVHFHLTNILLHVAASWLLFVLLGKLGYDRRLSLMCTLIFAVHPSLTSAVAWVLGRNDSLMAVFALASFILFLSCLENFRKRCVVLHAFALALAMLSKETGVMCVPVFLAYLTLVEPGKTNRRQKFMFLSIWVVILASWFLLRLSSDGLEWLSPGYMLQGLLNAPAAFVLYASKSIVPANLSVRPWLMDFNAWLAWPAVAFVLLTAIIARPGMRKRIYYGIAWYVIFLAPSMISRSSYFEHRIYLPIIGMFMILPEFYLALKERYPVARKMMDLAVLPIIAVFFVITSFHRDDYVNVMTYWQNASFTVPSSLEAQANLARVYYSDYGDVLRAEKAFAKCQQIDPYEFEFNIDMCNMYISRKRYAEAEAIFKEMLTKDTAYKKVVKDLVYFYYAGSCRKQGRVQEAEQFYRKAIALNPFVIDYYRAIIDLYEKTHNRALSAYYRSLIKQELRYANGRLRYIDESSCQWARRTFPDGKQSQPTPR